MAEKKELKWIVYRHDFNSRTIVPFNIFDHWKFAEDVEKDLKKYKNKDEFAKRLKSELFYYFASKCEYEVVITSWPPYIDIAELYSLNKERDEWKEKWGREPFCLDVNLTVGDKIDIYEQVMNNFEIFLDYVWNSKIHRPRKPKETPVTEPVAKTGVWIRNHGNGWHTCSVCNRSVTEFDEEGYANEFKFCPYCGTKMEKVIEDVIL